MKNNRHWPWICQSTLALAGIMFGLLLLSHFSYWSMRLFHLVALPINGPLLLGSLIVAPVTWLWPTRKNREMWIKPILIWLLILSMALINCWVGLIYQVELTTQASFQQYQYYLVRFNHLQTYTYRLYQCDRFGLLCHRSSGYLGIPYQHDPIILKYDRTLEQIYIQNRDERITIPD